jgi:hypothetical protein
MSKEGGVREVEKPGSVISHCVDWTWDIVMACKVAVEALMQGLDAKEICSRSCCTCAPASLPEDRGGVVVHVGNGVLADVKNVNNYVVLEDGSGQFQVTIGDGTGRVI